MNTFLEKLFQEYNFSEKDRYDFLQIYWLLPDIKKKRVVDNFHQIALQIQDLKEDLAIEQEILLGKTLTSIEKRLASVWKKQLLSKVSSELEELKQML